MAKVSLSYPSAFLIILRFKLYVYFRDLNFSSNLKNNKQQNRKTSVDTENTLIARERIGDGQEKGKRTKK